MPGLHSAPAEMERVAPWAISSDGPQRDERSDLLGSAWRTTITVTGALGLHGHRRLLLPAEIQRRLIGCRGTVPQLDELGRPDPGRSRFDLFPGPPPVSLQGDLLLLGVRRGVDLEGAHPDQVERLVLLQDLVGVAVHGVPGGQRTDEIVFGQHVPGLLGDLPDRRLELGLARVHAAAGGDPPGDPWDTGIAVLEEQHAVVWVHHDHPYRSSGPYRAIRRVVRDDVLASAVGAHGPQRTD